MPKFHYCSWLVYHDLASYECTILPTINLIILNQNRVIPILVIVFWVVFVLSYWFVLYPITLIILES